MESEDYIYTYLLLLRTTAQLAPTNDKAVVQTITDKRFISFVQKYSAQQFGQQIRQMFIDMIHGGLAIGTICKDKILINSISSAGQQAIIASRKPKFISKLKKAATSVATNTLSGLLTYYLTRLV